MKYFVGVLQALSTGASAGVAAFAGRSPNAVVVLTFLMITCASVANVFSESPSQKDRGPRTEDQADAPPNPPILGGGNSPTVGAGNAMAPPSATGTPIVVGGTTGGQANGGA
jgi:hypothetical protein